MGLKALVKRIAKCVVCYSSNDRCYHKKLTHYTQCIHHRVKKTLHHGKGLVHNHRHVLLSGSHIFLVLLFLGFFHLNGVIFADEEPLTETPVVAIEVPIEVEIEPVVEDAVEEVVAESGTILTAGDVVLETGEVVSETGGINDVILSGDIDQILTGSEESEIVTGTAQDLTGEISQDFATGVQVSTGGALTGSSSTGAVTQVVVNEMGDVVEVVITAGTGSTEGTGMNTTFDPEVLTGDVVSTGDFTLLVEPEEPPLSVVYPYERIQISDSGYVTFDSLFSVTTTGGERGATYCSRITYENIFRILKAGGWTTDVLLLRGDAEDLIVEGLSGQILFETSSTGLLEIFSGSTFASGLVVYDIYADFLVANVKAYHRIALVYADDGNWYVLDPLRALMTVEPQTLSEYLEDYGEDMDVHWYIGHGYSPLSPNEPVVITGQLMKYFEGLGDVVEEGTGDVEIIEEIVEGEVIEVVEVETGAIEEGTGDVEIIEEVIEEEVIEEEVVEGYFTRAYVRGDYSEKIIELQKLLNWLDFYGEAFDGIYSNQIIESVYQYQLANDILTEQDPVSVRGYLGPSTRSALNASYVDYQMGLLDLPIDGCKKNDIECRKQKLEEALAEKGYMLSNRGLVRLSKEALIGSKSLDMETLEHEFLIPIVLQSENNLSGQIAEVQLPEGTIIKTDDGEDFIGEISVPEFIDTDMIQDDVDQEVIAAIDVGTDEKIHFKDEAGNEMFATFRIPAPGTASGDTVHVSYSQDGEERTYLTNVEVQLIDGEPYAIFEANHFTQFYLGVQIADFVINNDTPYTDSLSVTLNMYVPTATQMRFGNSTGERDAASREPYASTKSWTLTAGTGVKTVYAEFDNGTTMVTVEDEIIYLTQLVVGTIVFNEDFSPANYYSYDWTRQGTDWDSVAGAACYGAVGNCAHGDGQMTEAADWILTDPGLIDLSDAVSATMQVKVKEDVSFDNNDYFRVWCKNAGGSDVKIYEENGGNRSTNTTWHTREATVDPSCLIADARFKITQIANNTNEDVHVDDFVITKYTALANSGGVFASIDYSPDIFTTGSVVASLTGLSSGDVVVTNNNGSGIYVFTGNGSFTFMLENSEGITGEATATVDWIGKSRLDYEGTGFDENLINNGAVTGSIIVTLGTGDFSGAVADYIDLINVPSGLTGVYTLSGTDTLIITFAGNAISHAALDSISDLRVVFLTGAFVNMYPSEVYQSISPSFFVTFIDPAGYISGQQLWLDGSLSGGQFYDQSPSHHITTNVGGTSSVVQSGETMMSFNGSSQYVQVGSYTLTDYSMSARFKVNSVDGARRSLFGDAAGSFELSLDTSNKLQAYNNGRLTSSNTISPNIRYHVVLVKDGAGTKMYLNGVLDNSNTNTTTLSNVTLSIGNSPYYSQFRNGFADEVKIYDKALNLSQVEDLYILKPSYTNSTLYISTGDLSGLSPETDMSLSLTISGVTYPVTNNGNGTWTASNVGPFASGTYDVELNYTNVYGKTGSVFYTGGLLVEITVDTTPPTASVIYVPAFGSRTSGDVVAMVTGFSETVTGLNATGYLFTGNGSFVFSFEDLAGNTGSAIATVDWIDKEIPSASLVSPLSGTYFSGSTLFSRTGYDNVAISGYIYKVYNSTGTQIYLTGISGTGIYFDAGDGNYTWNVIISDAVGNTSGTLSRGFIIDKTLPTFTGVISGTIYTTGVIIAFSDLNLSGALLNGAMYTGTLITGTGNYVFVVNDKAGNSTGASFSIEISVEGQILNALLSGGYQTGVATLLPSASGALVGSANIDMSIFDGQLLLPIVLQSSNYFEEFIAEIEIPAGAVVETSPGVGFTGVLQVPVFQELDDFEIPGQYIYALWTVGDDDPLYFKDQSGNALDVEFRFPAPGMEIGDTIDVYYSEDGIDWTYEVMSTVQDLAGEPYVVFTANHFTQFYLGEEIANFVINNDATNTTGLNVTLNSSVSGATDMRFGNSIAQRDAASWVSYQATYPWTLAGPEGVNHVYAQFSGNGVIRNVSDDIIYDTTALTRNSGLILHLDASNNGTQFYDISNIGHIATGYNGISSTTTSGEEMISLTAASNHYIEITSGVVSGYPFTFSAWVKPDTVGINQVIAVYGDASNGAVFDQIRIRNTNRIAASSRYGGTQRYAQTAAAFAQADERYHVVGIFNSLTNRQIYVNGVLQATNTQDPGSIVVSNPQFRVGRFRRAGTNYFDGTIDEVRVYGKALNQSEISGLYLTPPTLDPLVTYTGAAVLYGTFPDEMYDVSLVISGTTYPTTGDGTGKWKSLPLSPALADGVYDVTLNYTNIYTKTGSRTYTSGLTIDLDGPYVEYNPSTFTTGNVIATLTGLDPTYIIVNNSGSEYYTFTENGSFERAFVNQVGTTGYVTATVDWIRKSSLSFSTLNFYENQVINNGSISGNMIVTLGTGSFSGNVSNYVTLNNVPAGLTGVLTLSGTNKLIVTLSGNANSHTSGDNINNLAIEFFTGAFVNINPSDVIDSSKTGLSITFFDPNPTSGIAPSDDTMIDADTYEGGVGNCADGKCQRMNYGAMDYLCASDFGSKNLLRFDVNSALPTGAIITSVQLNLYRYNIGGDTLATGFTIKKIINNAGWIEGTRAAQEALTGEPNYIQRKWQEENWYNGSPGMQQGLDYASTNLIILGGFTGPNNTSYNQSFDLNSAGVSLVQSWVDYPEDNQGVVMGDIPSTWLCIRSKEYTTESQRPSLSVTYYVDVLKPSLLSFSPANASTGVSVNANLIMNFDENVWAVSGKNIYIKKLSDNSVVETINVTDTGSVNIINAMVVITPSDDFESYTGYYINVDNGAFRDRAYNTFDGVTGTTYRWFTTINNQNIPIVTGAYFTGVYANTGILGGIIESTGSGNLEERGVCRSTSPGFNDCQGAISVVQTGTWSATGSFEFVVTDLPAGTLVYSKAFAKNIFGVGYSSQSSFWTRPDAPIITSPTKIDNEGLVARREHTTGANNYSLYLALDSGFTSYVTGYGPITGLTTNYLKIVGLEKLTQYYYKIGATNNGGNSLLSDYTGVITTFYPSPLVWLKFEETAGNIAYDSAEGNYRDGINLNASVNKTGVDGRGYCYNGTNADVNIVNFSYGSRYTIGFWFNTTSTGNNMHMFSHGGDSATSSINVILDGAAQTLKTYVNGNQSLFVLGSGVYNELIDGDWHYYTVSIDNDGAVTGKYQVVVYVDGLYELIDASLDSTAYVPTNNLVIGRVSDTSAGYYSGCIDDFRIFDKVLSTGEVWDLYNQLKPGSAGTLSITGPVALDFGEWITMADEQVISIGFTGSSDYFTISDTLGSDLGYYTTLAISDFSSASGDYIPNTNINVKALTGIVLLSGDANTRVESLITGSYQTLGTGSLTFLRRQTGINNNVKGEYGMHLGFEVTIPALQAVGDYTGVVTFTLYDN